MKLGFTGTEEDISSKDHRDVHASGNRKPHKVLILRFLNQSLPRWLEAQRTSYEYSGMGPSILPRPVSRSWCRFSCSHLGTQTHL